MFIIVPLGLIGLSLVGLAFVIWRKWPFLKKLEPDAHQVGESFVHDLAPEAVERAKNVDWRSWWHQGMNGVEESLKAVRSAFTAIGQASERLRSSVQSVKESVSEKIDLPERSSQPEKPIVTVPPRDDEAEQQRLLKTEEQKLILDIAQDPKNVNLYIALGRVYSKLNNIPDAIESYKTASKIDPDDTQVKERLERLEERLKREEAEREPKEKEKEIENETLPENDKAKEKTE